MRPTRQLRRWADILLGRTVTLLLAATALVLGIATFVLLAAEPNTFRPDRTVALVLSNLSVLLLLGAALAGRITRMVVERRRGSAGSRLHVRLVLLFSVVAVVPVIVVSGFAAAFFSLGIQTWFNDRVRTALNESLQTSRGYLEEHRLNIRSDAIGMANELSPIVWTITVNPSGFADLLAQQTNLRGLTEAVVFDPDNGSIAASASQLMGYGIERASPATIDLARTGAVAVLDNGDRTQVRAVVQLSTAPELMLMVGRPVDQSILQHMSRNEQAVTEYQNLDRNRSRLEVAFVLIFALVTLLVLMAAVLIGLMMATQIARPIGRLILAAERVRGGDLGTRVPETMADDELAGLSRAFNRMTGQLNAQRSELMDAYGQIDGRRRFTETVLSGVSAGVIGLDARGRIELPNRAASDLLARNLMLEIGHKLDDVVPEFAELVDSAAQGQDRSRQQEIQIGPAANRRTLMARIGADMRGERSEGFVVTFDDITELQSAQRKAAWADVARRIAHEIKNPLTPIQLSAERLKRRFAREITSDPETFSLCADTIVRHVGDIGRMVDEFSAFARMPMPVIRPEDVGRIVRESLVLQKASRPNLVWDTHIPAYGPMAACDRRLLGQAITNLLQNAADAVAMRDRAGDAQGWIGVTIGGTDGEVTILIDDDGVGLPADRDRLTEPYVTHKPKGTGLGLAIVKKIMEDHGGRLVLQDRDSGPGTRAALFLPRIVDGA